MPRPVLLLLSAFVLVAARLLPAQEKSLHWRSVAVEARLDSAGRLHVRERQVMVFTGDWNGGERRFDVRVGQQFAFDRLLRVDSTNGEHELSRGDLSDVDQYDWRENRTLRWRSRRPSDPLFDQTALTYVLEYSYSNIVIPKGQEYLLDHDFAFADRGGEIEQFTLILTLDRVWRAPASFTGTYSARHLPPGEGFVVGVPLQYRGAGRPAGVLFGAAPAARYALAAVLLAGLVVLGVLLLRRERSLGRFAPLVPTTAIDDAWLAAHVFHLLPELVGAAWDDTTGAPEVAAVLARLVAEKKLGSSVESSGRGLFRRNVLHLTLLVGRSELKGHELALINALFSGSSTVTDTDAVRKRYASTGFDPASKIRTSLEKMLNTSKTAGAAAEKPSRTVTLILFLSAVALFVMGGAARVNDAVLAGLACAIALPVYGFAISQAAAWQTRVQALAVHSLRFLIPMAVLAGSVIVRLTDEESRTGVIVLAGLVALCLALVNSVLNKAKARQSATHLLLRRHLASGREYFREQLKKPQPSLRDEWFPYLIAFGLGKHIDRWFRAFGGESVSSGAGISTVSTSTSSGSSSGSGSVGSTSWSGMGGGGGFGGGGSSGMWAAAAGSMAAGVAAPSSSSSSGGGGGSSSGGSSGGGGGGGW